MALILLGCSVGRYEKYSQDMVLVTSYLCFYAELLSRHSGERRTVECRIPSAGHGSLEGYAWTSAQ